MLAVPAATCRCCGTAARPAARGRAAATTSANSARQSSRRSDQRGPRPEATACSSIVVALEDLGDVGPEPVERGLHPRRRFRRCRRRGAPPSRRHAPGGSAPPSAPCRRCRRARRRTSARAGPEQLEEGREQRSCAASSPRSRRAAARPACRLRKSRSSRRKASWSSSCSAPPSSASSLPARVSTARAWPTRSSAMFVEGDVLLERPARGRTIRPGAGRGSGRCRRCAAGTAPKARGKRGSRLASSAAHMWSSDLGSS